MNTVTTHPSHAAVAAAFEAADHNPTVTLFRGDLVKLHQNPACIDLSGHANPLVTTVRDLFDRRFVQCGTCLRASRTTDEDLYIVQSHVAVAEDMATCVETLDQFEGQLDGQPAGRNRLPLTQLVYAWKTWQKIHDTSVHDQVHRSAAVKPFAAAAARQLGNRLTALYDRWNDTADEVTRIGPAAAAMADRSRQLQVHVTRTCNMADHYKVDSLIADYVRMRCEGLPPTGAHNDPKVVAAADRYVADVAEGAAQAPRVIALTTRSLRPRIANPSLDDLLAATAVMQQHGPTSRLQPIHIVLLDPVAAKYCRKMLEPVGTEDDINTDDVAAVVAAADNMFDQLNGDIRPTAVLQHVQACAAALTS